MPLGHSRSFIANSLHFLSPELNVLFATGGVGAISLVIANSIIQNIIELLPAADRPIAQAIVSNVEQEVQSVSTYWYSHTTTFISLGL